MKTKYIYTEKWWNKSTLGHVPCRELGLTESFPSAAPKFILGTWRWKEIPATWTLTAWQNRTPVEQKGSEERRCERLKQPHESGVKTIRSSVPFHEFTVDTDSSPQLPSHTKQQERSSPQSDVTSSVGANHRASWRASLQSPFSQIKLLLYTNVTILILINYHWY